METASSEWGGWCELGVSPGLRHKGGIHQIFVWLNYSAACSLPEKLLQVRPCTDLNGQDESVFIFIKRWLLTFLDLFPGPMFTAHSMKTPEMLSSAVLGNACLNLVQDEICLVALGSYSVYIYSIYICIYICISLCLIPATDSPLPRLSQLYTW